MKATHCTRFWALFLPLLLVGLPLAACGSRDSDENAQPVSFRLKWLVYSSFAPHFVALHEGYYADEGLDVTIHPGGPGLDPIKLVASGADDVGLASYDQILMAREKGIPIVAIGEDTVKSGVGFLSLAESGIRKPADFVGRKVGVMPGTDKWTVYEALMTKVGVDRTEIVELPIGFDLGLLLNGTVEVFPAFITNQPIVAGAKGFEVNVIDPWEYGIRPGGNVFFTSEETLREKGDTLERFLRAELRGVLEAFRMSDEEVVDIVLQYNDRLDRDTEIEIWKATKEILLTNDTSRLGLMASETWTHTAELAEAYGLLEHDAVLEGSYTNDLVSAARSDVLED